MPARYAIYYAPDETEPLNLFARSWLGRDALAGREHPLSRPKYLPAAVLEQVTASPRHYGFHATLKPPFALAPGRTAEELAPAVKAFAKEASPLAIPRLILQWIGGFLALAPQGDSHGLLGFAGECVRRFDGFRAPPGPEETRKRLAAGLSPRQRQLLAQWGYPYVMEEFRFHLTLTGKLHDPDLKEQVQRESESRLNSILGRGLVLGSICLFRQPDLDRPFNLVQRFSLAAG